jgi:predicted Rossmann fold nucleotide-binding protein DprA/Smf involved in DNA uptake
VLAVPGSIRSAASAGTNWLLSQGAQPCCGVDDVLVAMGLSRAPDDPEPPARPRAPGDPDGGAEPTGAGPADGPPRTSPTGDGRRILRAIGWHPATLDEVVERTGLGLGAVAVALDGLEADGWIERGAGRVERRADP